MISSTEENYLKCIFKIAEKNGKAVGTNAVAAEMQTSAASVTDMLKRLAEKNLISHEKYRGVLLTGEGDRIATALIRKHRLWEVFLVEKLGLAWDQVHDLAEQLEHVQGEDLVDRLDAFLGSPRFDPHGDPIPDAKGQWAFRQQTPLASLAVGAMGAVTGVEDHSPDFLRYLDRMGLTIGAVVAVLEYFSYDQSVRVRIGSDLEVTLSDKVAKNLYVKTEE